ncbi:MAG: GntR family transcriptional regulator [Streptosporangiaceae bacterium]|nr:GntR family transcriptional regulator [Streptosporangiaceae bacterium]
MTDSTSAGGLSTLSLTAPDNGIFGQRTSDSVARVLRLAIIDGRLRPGTPLREVTLAEQLGVSRTPIREALFTLSRENLVDLKPNRGATVRRFTRDDLADVYGLRATLEAHAARMAAGRITDEQVTRLRESCDRLAALREGAKPSEQAAEDYTFHSLMTDATGSRQMQSMVREVLAFTITYRSDFAYTEAQMRHAEQQHREVTAALAARDGDLAGRLLQGHVLWSRELALSHFHDPAE